jgi:hypothetical protein
MTSGHVVIVIVVLAPPVAPPAETRPTWRASKHGAARKRPCRAIRCRSVAR